MPNVPRITPLASVRTFGALVALIIGLVPAMAHAQNAARPGKWTIELYGGGSAGSASTSGTAIEGFEPGVPFAVESGQISRAVPSWFFGDGALLLNQAVAHFSNITGTPFPGISPLDTALLAPGGTPGNGAVVGIRVGRSISAKLAVELSVERSLAPIDLNDDLKAALQAGSDSFKAAWQGLLGTAPVTNLSVTSTLTMDDGSGGSTRIAGAAKWTVFSGDRLEGYLTGGGGFILNGSEGPSAILNGRYTFRYFGLFPMDETDRVVVRVTPPKNSLMGIVGGGATYDLSSSTGLRADVRLMLNSTRDVTSLTAAPAVARLTPANVLTSVTSPGLQFSTQANIRSSLSAPNANVTLFTGSGLSRQIAFSLGIFKRF